MQALNKDRKKQQVFQKELPALPGLDGKKVFP